MPAVQKPADASEPALAAIVAELRRSGARFAYLYGSRASGTMTDRSDIDVAAWFGGEPPMVWEIGARLPTGVDLLVLDEAPLTLAGRVALRGQLLFDDDTVARVRWEADTRKRYADEEPRRRQAREDFVAARMRRGRS